MRGVCEVCGSTEHIEHPARLHGHIHLPSEPGHEPGRLNYRKRLRDLPQGVYEGANRYDTDNESVLHLWRGGQSWDIRWPKDRNHPRVRLLEAERDAAIEVTNAVQVDARALEAERDDLQLERDTYKAERDALENAMVYARDVDLPLARESAEALIAARDRLREERHRSALRFVALETERDQLIERLTGLVEKWRGEAVEWNGSTTRGFVHPALRAADELDSIIHPKPEETG